MASGLAISLCCRLSPFDLLAGPPDRYASSLRNASYPVALSRLSKWDRRALISQPRGVAVGVDLLRAVAERLVDACHRHVELDHLGLGLDRSGRRSRFEPVRRLAPSLREEGGDGGVTTGGRPAEPSKKVDSPSRRSSRGLRRRSTPHIVRALTCPVPRAPSFGGLVLPALVPAVQAPHYLRESFLFRCPLSGAHRR